MTLFILGAPRSGTTLLYKALCLHPDAAWLSNWNRRVPAQPAVSVLNRVPRAIPRLREVAWFDGTANAYVYGARRRIVTRAIPAPVEGEPVYARCGFDERAPSGGTADEVALQAVVTDTCRYSGGHVFIGKRIANNRRVVQLARALPDARFVLLVRDGRAVSLSLSEVDWWADTWLWWCGMTPAEWAAEGGDAWTLCGRTWVEELSVAMAGLRAVTSDRVMTLRYEDLLRSPLPVLRDVASFAGLEPVAAWEASAARLSFPNRNDRWPRTLAVDVLRRLTEMQRDLLTEFGYAV